MIQVTAASQLNLLSSGVILSLLYLIDNPVIYVLLDNLIVGQMLL